MQEQDTELDSLFQTTPDDDDFTAFMRAMSGQESGGSKDPYGARNGRTGASGKHQIMPNNFPRWSREHIGRRGDPSNPLDQEATAYGEARKYWEEAKRSGADPVEYAALKWYTGNGARGKNFKMRPAEGEPSPEEYVASIRKRLGTLPSDAVLDELFSGEAPDANVTGDATSETDADGYTVTSEVTSGEIVPPDTLQIETSKKDNTSKEIEALTAKKARLADLQVAGEGDSDEAKRLDAELRNAKINSKGIDVRALGHTSLSLRGKTREEANAEFRDAIARQAGINPQQLEWAERIMGTSPMALLSEATNQPLTDDEFAGIQRGEDGAFTVGLDPLTQAHARRLASAMRSGEIADKATEQMALDAESSGDAELAMRLRNNARVAKGMRERDAYRREAGLGANDIPVSELLLGAGRYLDENNPNLQAGLALLRHIGKGASETTTRESGASDPLGNILESLGSVGPGERLAAGVDSFVRGMGNVAGFLPDGARTGIGAGADALAPVLGGNLANSINAFLGNSKALRPYAAQLSAQIAQLPPDRQQYAIEAIEGAQQGGYASSDVAKLLLLAHVFAPALAGVGFEGVGNAGLSMFGAGTVNSLGQGAPLDEALIQGGVAAAGGVGEAALAPIGERISSTVGKMALGAFGEAAPEAYAQVASGQAYTLTDALIDIGAGVGSPFQAHGDHAPHPDAAITGIATEGTRARDLSTRYMADPEGFAATQELLAARLPLIANAREAGLSDATIVGILSNDGTVSEAEAQGLVDATGGMDGDAIRQAAIRANDFAESARTLQDDPEFMERRASKEAEASVRTERELDTARTYAESEFASATKQIEDATNGLAELQARKDELIRTQGVIDPQVAHEMETDAKAYNSVIEQATKRQEQIGKEYATRESELVKARDEARLRAKELRSEAAKRRSELAPVTNPDHPGFIASKVKNAIGAVKDGILPGKGGNEPVSLFGGKYASETKPSEAPKEGATNGNDATEGRQTATGVRHRAADASEGGEPTSDLRSDDGAGTGLAERVAKHLAKVHADAKIDVDEGTRKAQSVAIAKAIEVGAKDAKIAPEAFEKLLFGGKSLENSMFGVLALRRSDGMLHETAKGAFDQKAKNIYVTSKGNPSTAIHEFFHALRPNLAPNVQVVAGEWAASLTGRDGWEAGSEWTRDMEEAWSRGAEQFILSGEFAKGTPKEVRDAYTTLRQALARVYGSLYHSDLEVTPEQLTEHIQQVYRHYQGAKGDVKASEGKPATPPSTPPHRAALANLKALPAGSTERGVAVKRLGEAQAGSIAEHVANGGDHASYFRELTSTGLTPDEAIDLFVVAKGYDPQSKAAKKYRKALVQGAKDANLYQDERVKTDTPEFKKWFGESKVVDEKGEPLVVYHGTRVADFDIFSPRVERGDSFTFSPLGSWFTDAPRIADNYAREGAVYPVYLSLKNPRIISYDELSGLISDQRQAIRFRHNLEAKGYDGLKVGRHGGEDGYDYVAFEPTQIKSVFNRGTFDPNDPNILYQDERVKTDTPEFKAWSKGLEVKQAGRAGADPMIVEAFHRGSFDETYDPIPQINGEGFHFGTKQAADERPVGKYIDDNIKSIETYEDDDGWHWTADGYGSYDLGLDGFTSEQAARTDAEQTIIRDSEYSDLDEVVPLTQAYIRLENPIRMADQKGDWTEAIKEAKAKGHDSIVYRNDFEDRGKDSYVVFSPAQIKSVFNRGTFSEDDPNILYQKLHEETPEDAKKNPLVAIHNTTANGIRAILKLGGLPVPSIAVTKPNLPFDGFGEISLIAPSHLLSEDAIEAGMEVAAHLADGPTDIFESKPQRAVDLSEFKAALVPEGTPKDVIDALEAHGVETITYSGRGEGGERSKILQSRPDLLFQAQKYTDTDVAEMRRMYDEEGYSLADIAEAYGLDRTRATTIRELLTRRSEGFVSRKERGAQRLASWAKANGLDPRSGATEVAYNDAIANRAVSIGATRKQPQFSFPYNNGRLQSTYEVAYATKLEREGIEPKVYSRKKKDAIPYLLDGGEIGSYYPDLDYTKDGVRVVSEIKPYDEMARALPSNAEARYKHIVAKAASAELWAAKETAEGRPTRFEFVDPSVIGHDVITDPSIFDRYEGQTDSFGRSLKDKPIANIKRYEKSRLDAWSGTSKRGAKRGITVDDLREAFQRKVANAKAEQDGLLFQDERNEKMVKAYGITDDPRKAGFILPDGRLVNMRRENFTSGHGFIEHIDALKKAGFGDPQGQDFEYIAKSLAESGLVRMQLVQYGGRNSLDLEIGKPLTSKQIDIILDTLADPVMIAHGFDSYKTLRGDDITEAKLKRVSKALVEGTHQDVLDSLLQDSKAPKGFYYETERALANPKLQIGKEGFKTGEKAESELRRLGVKPEELSDLGLSDLFKSRKGKPVSRDEIEATIAANKLEVKETRLGAGTYQAQEYSGGTPLTPRNFNTEEVRARAIETFMERGRNLGFSYQSTARQRRAIEERGEAALSEIDVGLREAARAIINPDAAAASARKSFDGPALYEGYKTKDASNYREILYRMPNIAKRAVLVQGYGTRRIEGELQPYETWRWEDERERPISSGEYATREEAIANAPKAQLYLDVNDAAIPELRGDVAATPYTSPHWKNHPNVFAHTRVGDLDTAYGKTLVVDEIQSDWHQTGKAEGYAPADGKIEGKTVADWYAEAIRLEQEGGSREEINRAVANRDRLAAKPDGEVPDAPLKDSWQNFVVKAQIAEAVKGGYDAIAIPTGKVQAERYGLDKQVKQIDYIPKKDGTYKLAVFGKDGHRIDSVPSEPQTIKQIENLIGKEMAQKIVEGVGEDFYRRDGDVEPIGKSLAGDDLKIEARGMRSFYDEKIPSFLNKYLKRFGARVEAGSLQNGPNLTNLRARYIVDEAATGNGYVAWDTENARRAVDRVFPTAEDAQAYITKTYGDTSPAHIVRITPEMREHFSKEDQPLYQAAQATNPFNQAAQQGAQQTLPELFSSYMKANALSNPSTHAANILSNALHAVATEAASVPAGFTDMLAAGLITGERTTTISPRATARALRDVASLRNDGNEDWQKGGFRRFYETITGANDTSAKHDWSKPAHRALEVYGDTMFRILGAEDALFNAFALRRSLEDQALAMAKTERRTNRSLDIRARADTLVASPTSQMVDVATADASRATFQNSNRISEWISDGKAMIRDIPTAGPLLRLAVDQIVPFEKTPTNIILQGLDFSPIGIVKGADKALRLRRAMADAALRQALGGDEGIRVMQRQMAQQTGWGVIGTALLAGLAMGAKGLLQARIDPDDNEEKNQAALSDERGSGYYGGSMKVGSRWVDVKGIGPAGIALLASAEVGRALERGEGASGATTAAIGSLWKSLWEQPLLRGFEDVKGLTEKGEKGEAKRSRYAASVGSRVIPGSAFLAAVAKDMDEWKRITPRETSAKDRILGNLPIVGRATREAWPKAEAPTTGEPMKNDVAKLLPFNVEKDRETPIGKIARELDIKPPRPRQHDGEDEAEFLQRKKEALTKWREGVLEATRDEMFKNLPDRVRDERTEFREDDEPRSKREFIRKFLKFEWE